MLLEIGGDQREVERSVHHPCSFLSVSSCQDLAVMVSFISLGVIRWFPMEHFVDNPKST